VVCGTNTVFHCQTLQALVAGQNVDIEYWYGVPFVINIDKKIGNKHTN
jgi:hypothetical protein